MARPSNSRRVILSAAIVSGTLLLGAIAFVEACPLRNANRSVSLSAAKRWDAPDSAVRQSDASDNSGSTVRLPRDSKSSFGLIKTSIAGFGTIAGGLLVGVIYQLRRPRNVALSDAAFVHPELEHPELALTSLPKEALPAWLADPVVPVR